MKVLLLVFTVLFFTIACSATSGQTDPRPVPEPDTPALTLSANTPIPTPTVTPAPTNTPEPTAAPKPTVAPTPRPTPKKVVEQQPVPTPPLASYLVPEAKIEWAGLVEKGKAAHGGTLYEIQARAKIINPQAMVDGLEVIIAAEDVLKFMPSTASPKAVVQQNIAFGDSYISVATFFLETDDPPGISIEVVKLKGPVGNIMVKARLICTDGLGQRVPTCGSVLR